jgi:hypothetical protein
MIPFDAAQLQQLVTQYSLPGNAETQAGPTAAAGRDLPWGLKGPSWTLYIMLPHQAEHAYFLAGTLCQMNGWCEKDVLR